MASKEASHSLQEFRLMDLTLCDLLYRSYWSVVTTVLYRPKDILPLLLETQLVGLDINKKNPKDNLPWHWMTRKILRMFDIFHTTNVCPFVPFLGTLDVEFRHEGHHEKSNPHLSDDTTLYDILYRTSPWNRISREWDIICCKHQNRHCLTWSVLSRQTPIYKVLAREKNMWQKVK